MPVIDAHVHFWQLDAPWHRWPSADLRQIHRDFGPGDLLPTLPLHGVDGVVLVQSQPNDDETDWLLSLAERHPAVLAVVGWIDLTAPNAAARIDRLAAHPKLRGLRPMLQDLPADWVLQPAAAAALAAVAAHDLAFDALIRPIHLPAITRLAERHPDLRIVVDHLAKPHIAGLAWQPWADDLATLAMHPQVYCKLSGIVTESRQDWTLSDLARYAAHVLASFGGNRVLWGSDWPVVQLRATYAQWRQAAHALVPEQHHAAVFGDSACAAYRLTLSAPRL